MVVSEKSFIYTTKQSCHNPTCSLVTFVGYVVFNCNTVDYSLV